MEQAEYICLSQMNTLMGVAELYLKRFPSQREEMLTDIK